MLSKEVNLGMVTLIGCINRGIQVHSSILNLLSLQTLLSNLGWKQIFFPGKLYQLFQMNFYNNNWGKEVSHRLKNKLSLP